jgi:hypothetical protein
MPEAKPAIETKPKPVVVQNPQMIISAIQQRQTAAANLQAAEAMLQNTVLQSALELRIDPSIYDMAVTQNEKGAWEFRAK